MVPALQETAGRLRPSALVRLLTPGEGPAAAYDRLLKPCPDEPEIWVVVDQFASRKSSRTAGAGRGGAGGACWFAARRFFRRLVKGTRTVPRVVVTDKLRSYGAAHWEAMSSVGHRSYKGLNNRDEQRTRGST